MYISLFQSSDHERDLWVGGRYENGMWRWEGRLTSTISDQSSLWHPGQPNENDSVLYIYLYQTDNLLSDTTNDIKWFVCEAVFG